MKKFDWFMALVMFAIVENTICFIIQGGWLASGGLLFGGFWVWVAYWDWKHKQVINLEQDDIQAMCNAFRRIGNCGVTVDELSSALNGACSSPHSVGDVTCKFNARSPYLRCAINPDGLCQECQHYEKL